MMKKWISIFLATAMLLSFSACSGNNAETTDTDTQTTEDTSSGQPERTETALDDITVAYLAPTVSLAAWANQVAINFEANCKARGWNYIVMDAEGDSTKQTEQVDSVLLMDVDMVFLFPNDVAIASSYVRQFSEAEIPCIVIASNIQEDYWQYALAYVGANNEAMGEKVAEYALETLGADSEISYVVIDGVPGKQDYIDRYQGFINVMGETGWTELGHEFAFGSRADAQAAMENFLTAYPDVDLVFSTTDDLALGATIAIESEGRDDITVISITGMNEAFEAIRAGKILCTVQNKAADIMAKADELAYTYLSGGEIGEYLNIVDNPLITAENVDSYTAEY